MSTKRLRTAFRKSKVIAPLHTAGPFAVSSDGRRLYTTVNDEVILTDVECAAEICRFKGDETPVTALAVTPSNTHLLTFSTSLFLRVYELPTDTPTDSAAAPPRLPWVRQVPKGHSSPVHVMTVDPTSCYLASGSADGHVKVWDIHRGYATHHYHGLGGVVSAIKFNMRKTQTKITAGDEEGGEAWDTMHLYAGSTDGLIRVFDLRSVKRTEPIAKLDGHVSVPRSLSFTDDGKWLVSGGRDAVLLVWDLKQNGSRFNPKLINTIPVEERIEASDLVKTPEGQRDSVYAFTAGEKGVVRIWDIQSGKVKFTLDGQSHLSETSGDMEELRQIVNSIYVSDTDTIVTLHGDQNILFHSLPTRTLTRQFIGFNDQIVDTAFLSSSTPDSHLAVATNSSLIRVYNTSTLDARLLTSHSDMVLCIDKAANGRILGSGAKDKSARIWAPSDTDPEEWRCVAICEGHAESVGAIAFSRHKIEGDDANLRFMFTGSQDRTVKMWDLSSVPLTYSSGSPTTRPKSMITQPTHEKDINSLDVSPNNRYLATGSQDKTAKLYEIEYTPKEGGGGVAELRHLATLRGHKRGIWCVRFSGYERLVATASGDRTIKLWNLDDYSCVKTYEGHTNSVLRVDFFNRGMQLVTASADGLVKLWSVRNEECITSLDNHEEKIWAIALSSDEKTIVSGAGDSVVTFWQDCTELELQEKQAEQEKVVLKEQDFMNYISVQDYRNAILLALSMDQPGRLYNLFRAIRSQRASATSLPSDAPQGLTGSTPVDQVIKTLPPLELSRLLRHVRNWNANSKSYAVAQTVLHAILKLRSASDILKAFNTENAALADISNDTNQPPPPRDQEMRALKDLLDGLIPYTERHLARAEKLVQDSYVVDYILSEMDSGIVVGANDDAMDVDGQVEDE
ncbi:U3 small nucleolar RNA-associated protein 13 [Tulasnella sp. 403]|nr:U3 small nucleolar RNA-associated protein 13 [Tulasnella sp. 403]